MRYFKDVARRLVSNACDEMMSDPNRHMDAYGKAHIVDICLPHDFEKFERHEFCHLDLAKSIADMTGLCISEVAEQIFDGIDLRRFKLDLESRCGPRAVARLIARSVDDDNSGRS